MTSPQKTALSLLIAVVAFSAFSILAFSGLFDYIETNFYDPRVAQTVERRLGVGLENADRFHSHNRDRFEAILSESAFRNVFRVNQNVSDINSRDRLVGLLREEMSAFSGLRFVDLGRERLWLSTYERDIVTRTATSREFSPLSEVAASVPPEDLALEEGVEFAYRFEPELNQFIYRFLIYDEFDIARGTALVYVNGHGLSTSLVRAGTLGPGEEVRVVDERSVLLNAMDTHARESGEVLRELDWNSQQRGRPYPVIELGNEGFVVFRLVGQFGDYLWLAPERNFEMSEGMRWTLLGASFVTMFLLGFLLLNLRQDPTTVLSHRVKRFQIDLLREYIENKDQLDWDRWKGEIERRRSDVDKEIKRGIGRLKKHDEEQVDALLERSWDEIFQVIGGSRRQPAIESNVDFGRLEKMIERVVAGFQAGQLASVGSNVGASSGAAGADAGAGTANVAREPEEPEELEEEPEELEEEPEELEEEPEELEEEPEELEEEPEELEEEPEELEEEPEELEEEPEELEEELQDSASEFEVVDNTDMAQDEPVGDLKAELDTVQEDWELGSVDGGVYDSRVDEFLDSAEEAALPEDDAPDEPEDIHGAFPPFGVSKWADNGNERELSIPVDDDEQGDAVEAVEETLEVLEDVDDFDDEEASEIEAVEPSFALIDYGPSLVRRKPAEAARDEREIESLQLEEQHTELSSDETAIGEPVHHPDAAGDLESTGDKPLLDYSGDSDESHVLAPSELPEIADCDLLTIESFLDVVKTSGAHVAVRVEDEDGVPRIDVAMYESQVQTDSGIQELVDSIISSADPDPDTGTSHGEDELVAGIDSLFDGPDLEWDLKEGSLTDEKHPQSQLSGGSSKKRSALLINKDGVLYDLHAAGYRNSDSGMVKSLIAFTRIWRAQFGALLVPYEDGLHIQYSLGIPGEDTELFVIPNTSEFRTKVLDQRLVALLRGPLGDHQRIIGFPGEAAFSTGQTLFLPIKFRALSGYALLGLRHSAPNIQSVVERANLDAIQVHS